ncbi:ROK family protein [Pseudooceanicola sediminis]|uniref:ROK family protein n=1 Tax=Pseudooceanicola sediminis TaxID=2211117 RepID=A0A399J1S3_9RHOB|nr:ROK family protein [Pseudooceanicola sediminis]KAA2316271.1 ROK family protein [Puniceibacterium sp. HSS470]RII39181.1 ROK family protein [Pseudooceanicola sediminis]|tara:strand:+ start:60797 stop:61708 length:912 start_codon:yes stop_codon:yes gene_type:complete
MKLVADVGGTNVRFALVEGDRVQPDTISSFRNDDFATFRDAAAQYIEDKGKPALTRMAIAVAGPVNGTHARLTNREWYFDTVALAADFGVSVALLNDLKALGYSVSTLSADSFLRVTPHIDIDGAGDQRLVAGIGTGFNVSPVVMTQQGVVCPNAEMGHIQLSWRLYQAVADQVGHGDHGYDTVEHLFSGRGCEKLWRASSGSDLSFAQALAASTDQAIEFAGVYADMMAVLAQDLVLAFMPSGGLYFAGGVARAILTGPAAAHGLDCFRAAYMRPLALDTAARVPVSLILDDHAALSGCAIA